MCVSTGASSWSPTAPDLRLSPVFTDLFPHRPRNFSHTPRGRADITAGHAHRDRLGAQAVHEPARDTGGSRAQTPLTVLNLAPKLGARGPTEAVEPGRPPRAGRQPPSRVRPPQRRSCRSPRQQWRRDSVAPNAWRHPTTGPPHQEALPRRTLPGPTSGRIQSAPGWACTAHRMCRRHQRSRSS